MTNQMLIDWVLDPARTEYELQQAAHGLGLVYAGLTRAQLIVSILGHLNPLLAGGVAAWSPPPTPPTAPIPPPVFPAAPPILPLTFNQVGGANMILDVNQPYSSVLGNIGGGLPPYNVMRRPGSGALPNGLGLRLIGGNAAGLDGTPTTPTPRGGTTIAVRAEDSAGNFADENFRIVVHGQPWYSGLAGILPWLIGALLAAAVIVVAFWLISSIFANRGGGTGPGPQQAPTTGQQQGEGQKIGVNSEGFAGPITSDAKSALGLDVQRLKTEFSAFVFRDPQRQSSSVNCPAGWVCTVTEPDGAVKLYQGNGTKLNATAGTFRFIGAYPLGDAVRGNPPCELLAKEQAFGASENPSFGVSAGNFNCATTSVAPAATVAPAQPTTVSPPAQVAPPVLVAKSNCSATNPAGALGGSWTFVKGNQWSLTGGNQTIKGSNGWVVHTPSYSSDPGLPSGSREQTSVATAYNVSGCQPG